MNKNTELLKEIMPREERRYWKAIHRALDTGESLTPQEVSARCEEAKKSADALRDPAREAANIQRFRALLEKDPRVNQLTGKERQALIDNSARVFAGLDREWQEDSLRELERKVTGKDDAIKRFI